MNRKIIIFLFGGLLVVSIAIATGAFYSYRNEHAKNVGLQAQLDDLTARQRVTEGKLEDSKKTVSRLQTELQEVKAQVEDLNKVIAEEKSTRLDAVNKLDQLKEDLEQQKKLRQDLEDKLSQASNESMKMKEQFQMMQKQKDELETRIKELSSGSEGVELGTVVVNNEAAEGSKDEKRGANLEGKIMVVNKDYNFAVINLGAKDGVKVNEIFSVYRSGKVIGELKVEKVHESMSAAGFSEDLKDILSENDKVVQKAK